MNSNQIRITITGLKSFVLMLAIFSFAFAQAGDSVKKELAKGDTARDKIAVGLDLIQNDYLGNCFALNKLRLLFDPSEGFRIEGGIGYSSVKSYNSYTGYSSNTSKNSLLTLMLGLYKKYNLKKNDIYFGIQYLYSTSLYSPYEKTTEKRFGPLFGAEAYFLDCFSIAGEISILYENYLNKPMDDNYGLNEKFEYTIIRSNVSLVIRGYVF